MTNQLVENYLKLLDKNKLERKPLPKIGFEELSECWKQTGITKAEVDEFEYVFDDTAKDILTICFSPKTQRKGAVICGVKGIGKTFNMDVFATLNTNMFGIQTRCYEVGEIEVMYKLEGAVFLERLMDIPCLVINDAGAENLLNDYGTPRNLIADILILRYRAFQKFKHKTYLTTNKTWKGIKEHYGARLADRFQEMFNAIELKGESKR